MARVLAGDDNRKREEDEDLEGNFMYFILYPEAVHDLYNFHCPLNTTLSQFKHFLNNLSWDGVTQLLHAMTQAEKQPKAMSQHPRLSTLGMDKGRLWKEFGKNVGCTRHEFMNALDTIAPEDLEELKAAIEDDPVQDTEIPNQPARRARRLYRLLSKGLALQVDPGDGQRGISNENELSLDLRASLLRTQVRSFSRKHPIFTAAAVEINSDEHMRYLSDIYDYAISRGLNTLGAQECMHEAKAQYHIVRDWKLMQPANTPTELSSPIVNPNAISPNGETKTKNQNQGNKQSRKWKGRGGLPFSENGAKKKSLSTLEGLKKLSHKYPDAAAPAGSIKQDRHQGKESPMDGVAEINILMKPLFTWKEPSAGPAEPMVPQTDQAVEKSKRRRRLNKKQRGRLNQEKAIEELHALAVASETSLLKMTEAHKIDAVPMDVWPDVGGSVSRRGPVTRKRSVSAELGDETLCRSSPKGRVYFRIVAKGKAPVRTAATSSVVRKLSSADDNEETQPYIPETPQRPVRQLPSIEGSPFLRDSPFSDSQIPGKYSWNAVELPSSFYVQNRGVSTMSRLTTASIVTPEAVSEIISHSSISQSSPGYQVGSVSPLNTSEHRPTEAKEFLPVLSPSSLAYIESSDRSEGDASNTLGLGGLPIGLVTQSPPMDTALERMGAIVDGPPEAPAEPSAPRPWSTEQLTSGLSLACLPFPTAPERAFPSPSPLLEEEGSASRRYASQCPSYSTAPEGIHEGSGSHESLKLHSLQQMIDKQALWTPRRITGKQSQYFSPPTPPKTKRPPAGTVSCVPFPSLSQPSFGLIQEEVAHDPFRLLLAVSLLNKTKGTAAIPMFYALVERYPSPGDLSHANLSDVADLIKPLGLQNTRAENLINLAKLWVEHPPEKGRRYRTLNYPSQGAGKDIRPFETLNDEDERIGAWEVAHMPGCGAYAIDSWRVFCRDRLRGVADGYNGEGADAMFEPEWKRVVPKDKELKAFLRWMWLREGWAWDPLTGEKGVASFELLKQAVEGGLTWDNSGGYDDEVGKSTDLDHGSVGGGWKELKTSRHGTSCRAAEFEIQ